jgi:hypothetical protein
MSDIDHEMETIECTVPAGITSGELMNVQTQDGRIYSVQVPQGYSSGDLLRVAVTRSCSDGDSVQVMSQQHSYSNTQQTIGVAAASAIVGTLLVGPIVGVVVAGVAVYASTRDDQIGDVARGVGGAAMSAFDKGNELATRYHVKEKFAAATSATMSKLKEIDNEHHVVDKAKEGANKLLVGAKDFDTKYGISTKASGLVVSGISAGANEFLRATSRSGSSTARK